MLNSCLLIYYKNDCLKYMEDYLCKDIQVQVGNDHDDWVFPYQPNVRKFLVVTTLQVNTVLTTAVVCQNTVNNCTKSKSYVGCTAKTNVNLVLCSPALVRFVKVNTVLTS